MTTFDRRQGIGGSDAAAALGLSPWKTPYQLWLEKRGEGEPTEDSEPMYWGRALEEAVLARYERDTARQVFGRQERFEKDFMYATVDGQACAQGEDKPRLIEAKTASSTNGFGHDGSDEIPKQYLIQVQHNMLVTGLSVCDMPVLFHGSEYRCYTVAADPELQALIVEGERRFWQKVLDNVAPDVQNILDARSKYKLSTDKEVEATDSLAVKVSQLKTLKERMKVAEAEEKELQLAIMDFMKDSNVLTYEGETLVTWKAAKGAERFDAKAFKVAQPELAKQYTVTGEPTRRLLVK